MVIMQEKGKISSAMNARIIGSDDDERQTVILAHGFGGDQSVWDKIVPFLAEHYKVVVYDWMFSSAIKDQSLYDPVKYSSYDGFADDLIHLIDEMNLKSSVFIGHSMSGIIGCIASVKRPQLFQNLILIGTSPRYINDGDYKGGLEKSDVDQIITNIESNFQNWATYFASMVVDEKDPISLDKFEKCLKKMKPETALSLAKTVFNIDEREILDKVIVPCTIIQSNSDAVVPNSVAYYMQTKLNQGKSILQVVDTNGHFPQLTSHNLLLDVLATILGVSFTHN